MTKHCPYTIWINSSHMPSVRIWLQCPWFVLSHAHWTVVIMAGGIWWAHVVNQRTSALWCLSFFAGQLGPVPGQSLDHWGSGQIRDRQLGDFTGHTHRHQFSLVFALWTIKQVQSWYEISQWSEWSLHGGWML